MFYCLFPITHEKSAKFMCMQEIMYVGDLERSPSAIGITQERLADTYGLGDNLFAYRLLHKHTIALYNPRKLLFIIFESSFTSGLHIFVLYIKLYAAYTNPIYMLRTPNLYEASWNSTQVWNAPFHLYVLNVYRHIQLPLYTTGGPEVLHFASLKLACVTCI